MEISVDDRQAIINRVVLIGQASLAQSELEALVGVPQIHESIHEGDFDLARSLIKESTLSLSALQKECSLDGAETSIGFFYIFTAITDTERLLRCKKFKLSKAQT